MKKITEENIETFLEEYKSLHDSNIISINYDIEKTKLEMKLNLYWKKEEKTTKNIELVFVGIEEISIKETFSWDFINEVFFKYVDISNKKMLCFSTEKEEPRIYIICESVEYQEI